jgi:autotransporter-associated beta strand protein
MKPAFRNPFFAAVLAAAAFNVSSYAQTTLLTDSFDTVTSFTANPNADQTGLLSPASYTVTHPFGGTPIQRRGTGVLEMAFDGTTAANASRIFTDADYINVANTRNSPIRITFDIGASQVDWVGIVVGTTAAWLDGNGAITEFSALFRNDGTGNKWVNGTNLAGLTTDSSSLITLELRNTAGTGSPFNGTGSVAQLWRGTTNLGTYTLEQLSATNGRFALCTFNGNGGAGGTVDNLSIIATSTATLVPRWSGSVNGTWDDNTTNFSGQSFSGLKTAGATNVLFGDNDANSNPVVTSNVTIAAGGVEIADVVFDNVSTNYTLASADATGIKGGTNLAKSGTGLLTLTGAHSYTGTTTISSGTIALSGGNNRLPVTTALTLTSPGVLRLDGNNQTVASLASNGRVVNGNATLATLTVNNSSPATFSGNLGGTGTDENNLALVKDGTGTLSLSGPSSFTGGTTIEEGTLSLGYNSTFQPNTSLGPKNSGTVVTINSGGTLTGTQNNWISETSVASGGGNAISLVINPGGTLKGANGTLTGLGNVTLNGGTIEVSSGLNGFGWFAAYNLGGDITVSGSSPSSITSAAGAGISANLQMANGSNGGGGTRFLTVEDVTSSSASDLVISARLSNGTLVKEGLGTVEIAAGETGTGFPITWEITEGAFVVAEPATFEFRVNNTTSNRVLNTNTGSAAFNGTLNINTSGVTLTTGNTWSLIDVTGLAATFGLNFAVSGGFSDPNNDGVWTKSDVIGNWSFSETSGELILDVGSDYDTWGGLYGLAAGSEAGDLDGDGLTNFEEYAFGLIPNSGASVNPITVPLNKTTGTFSYTRRATPSTTELSYSIWYSTTLEAGSWIEDSGASQGAAALNGEVETVPVTLSSGLLTNPKLFIQVRAQ